MLDGWTDSDLMGCWADVYDDDHEEMQACEVNSVPSRRRPPDLPHDPELVSAVVDPVRIHASTVAPGGFRGAD
jgi:hypothetical protein